MAALQGPNRGLPGDHRPVRMRVTRLDGGATCSLGGRVGPGRGPAGRAASTEGPHKQAAQTPAGPVPHATSIQACGPGVGGAHAVGDISFKAGSSACWTEGQTHHVLANKGSSGHWLVHVDVAGKVTLVTGEDAANCPKPPAPPPAAYSCNRTNFKCEQNAQAHASEAVCQASCTAKSGGALVMVQGDTFSIFAYMCVPVLTWLIKKVSPCS